MIELNEQEKNILKGYRFVDLFCGIGGFHLALTSFGASCVFASEINASACKVYENNFHIKPKGDITKIRCKDIPPHDILCAGFPCQPFSISGNRKGFDDPNGKLFFEIVRIARFHKPQMILLENVKNLETHNNGKTLDKIREKLNGLGYKTFSKVLNATYYGVPQARKRIYIVAFRNNLKISQFSFPDEKKESVLLKCVEDILEKKDNSKYKINREAEFNTSIENNVEKSDKLLRIGQFGLGRQGERIYSIKGQATTLSSQGGGLGGKTGMYFVDGIVRRLSPRECARLMGFPDDFTLAESESDCYSQFGNSVVVNVLQEIIRKASKLMVKENKEDEKG